MLFHYFTILALNLVTMIHGSPISQQVCSRTKCTGKYTMKMPKEIDIPVGIKEVDIKILSYPEKIKIGMFKREVQWAYCYDGTILDINTGCHISREAHKATPKTAREYHDKNSCPTGFECPPYGTCWGSDAAKCEEENRAKLMVEKGPTSLKWVGVSWMERLYHTCTMSWLCNNIISEPTVFVKNLQSPKYYFYTPENLEIKIGYKLFESGIEDKLGYMYYLIEEPPRSETVTLRGKCYSSSPNNTKCIVTQESKWKGVVFNLNSFPTTIIRSNIITIMGSVITIKDNKLVNLTNVDNEMSYQPLSDLQRAPNIESLKETVDTISLLQMQSLYNEFENGRTIHRLSTLVTRLIREVSIKDSTALARITEGDFATQWLNWNYFEKCPCTLGTFTNDSNCQHDTRFVEGRIISETDTTRCKSIAGAPTTVVDLIHDEPLDSETIVQLPIQESNGESSEWEELKFRRVEQLVSDTSSNGDNNAPSNSFSINDFISSSLSHYFIMASSILSWVLLIMFCSSRR